MRTRTGPAVLLGSMLGCSAAPSSDHGDGTQLGDTSATETRDDTATSDGDLPPELDDCDRLEQLADAVLAQPEPAAQAELVDSFVREVGYGEHGFPIVESTRLCVAHVGPGSDNLGIAGDFNAWTIGEHPLTSVTAELAYAVVDLSEPPVGFYKLVRDDAEFFADPLARRFGWDAFGEYSQIDPLPDRSHHERWPAFDQGAGALEPRTLTVWLPPGALSGPPLPVVYMHDGQNLFSPDALFGGWQVGETLDEAIAADVLAPMIIVGIDNTPARFDEYTQVTDVLDNMVLGGRADEYADFLVGGIKPFIESRYPVDPAPAAATVMGSSLGGLVSLYIGLRHPDVLGQVASMSGTVDWGTFGAQNPTIRDAYLERPPTGLRIYLDSGGGPGLGCPDDGSDNYCGNVALADTLRGLGWVDEVDLFYRWEPDAPHNELAWAARLLPALLDLAG